jgi:hypothetical protein
LAASKNYNKEKYRDGDPLAYFESSKEHYLIHEDTKKLLYKLLRMLKEQGEDATFHYIKTQVLKRGYNVLKSNVKN